MVINKISLAHFDMDLGTPTLIGLEFLKILSLKSSITTFLIHTMRTKEVQSQVNFMLLNNLVEINKHLIFREYRFLGSRLIKLYIDRN